MDGLHMASIFLKQILATPLTISGPAQLHYALYMCKGNTFIHAVQNYDIHIFVKAVYFLLCYVLILLNRKRTARSYASCACIYTRSLGFCKFFYLFKRVCC